MNFYVCYMNVQDNDDNNYRSKMDALEIENTRKGTLIINAKRVSSDIYRSLKDLKKYFSKFANSRVKIIGDKLLIAGNRHNNLQKMLQKYINDNVLCQRSYKSRNSFKRQRDKM